MPLRPPTFNPLRRMRVAQSAQGYERRRGSARSRGYTVAWDKAAAAYRRANPLCVGCVAVGRYTPATCVDHVLPVEQAPDLFWDDANWQSSCTFHHSEVKQRLEDRWRAGLLRDADLRLDSEAAVALTRELRG